MPLAALALVLVAALLHALWNIAAKPASGDPHFALLCTLAIVGLWAPFGLAVGLPQMPHWGVAEWTVILGSGFVNLLYLLVLFRGYRESDLTVVYPVARGTGPLLSSMVAVALFGEHLGWTGVLGVAGVCGGIVLVAGGPSLWRGAHEPGRRERVRAGLLWGAATGTLIAGYTVIDGYAVKRLALSPFVVTWFGNVARLPLMAPSTWRRREGFSDAARRLWKPALLVGAVSPLAYILVLFALRMAPLSHVAPAREVSMLFAALVGGRLLGERDRGLRVAGAALMAAGVILLAWGG
jgi:drug/metabolite transporter (DMT)-like permease